MFVYHKACVTIPQIKKLNNALHRAGLWTYEIPATDHPDTEYDSRDILNEIDPENESRGHALRLMIKVLDLATDEDQGADIYTAAYCILTDGSQIYQSATYTEDELQRANNRAYQATAGNVYWEKGTPENSKLPKAATYSHIKRYA